MSNTYPQEAFAGPHSNGMAAALATILSVTMLSLTMGCSPKVPEPTLPLSSPVPTSTIGSELDDSVLTTSVKAALMSETSVKSMDLKVETNKGVVQLSGFVDDQIQVDRAVAVAKGVAGVKEVQNHLALKGGDTTVGNNLDDSMITTRVKTALLADQGTKSIDISVETRKGDVMLSGFVANKAQIALVEKVAAKQEGVHSVHNELSVKK